MASALATDPAKFSGWRMVVITFVILNIALGVNFTAYGALVEAIQRTFETSRTLASSGPSVLNVAMGLLAPVVGGMMRRVSVRKMMLIGAVMNAAGYVIISQVSDVWYMLACYALLIGPGFCLLGPIPCITVVSNWFVEGRGKAVGIINMPFGNTIMPIAAALMLQANGLRPTFIGMAILIALLIPMILLLVDRPDRIGQRARGENAASADGEAPVAALTSTQVLQMPSFWVITLGVGLLSAAGMVMVTHLISLATGRGIELSSASLLLAAFGVAGVAGAPIFGWLSDRVGGGKAFAILCLVQVLPWAGLLVVGNNFQLLMVCAFLIGLCSNAILTLFGTTTSEWLGAANVSVGMGLCYLLQIPFLFGAAPLAGAMFESTGSYDATIYLHIASFVVLGAIFLIYRPRVAVAATPSQPAAA